MTETQMPDEIPKTSYTCKDCSWFHDDGGSNRCGKKSPNVTSTEPDWKACIDFRPHGKSCILYVTLDELHRALSILGKDEECSKCPLMELCSKSELTECIRDKASWYLNAINQMYNEADGSDKYCTTCRFKNRCAKQNNNQYIETLSCSHHVMEDSE